MTPIFLAAAVALGAPQAKDPPKKDPPGLVGQWTVERLVVDGTPKALPPGTTWAFTADGKSALDVGGPGAPDEGTYTTDPKKDPAEVDIVTGARGANMR